MMTGTTGRPGPVAADQHAAANGRGQGEAAANGAPPPNATVARPCRKAAAKALLQAESAK